MRLFLVLLLAAADAAAATPKYSPLDGAAAVPLSSDNAYFRKPANPAPDYWALSSFYVPQYNGAACSAASVTMALNALINARRARGDSDENLLQQTLPEKVKGFDWKGLVSEGGSAGRHGVTLAQLGQAAREALAAGGAAGWQVSVTTVAEQSARALEDFRKALAANERGADDIMLLHFAQDAVTGAPGGPFAHVSPVGAYNAAAKRVLIMDVDRQWYEPYWAADARVFAAMLVKTPAFGSGGYVVLKRK
ncbi:MAG TPA: hypothetical protein DCZ92_15575 [Elusimicrobia bacterium]|nr:MAG: hypothetical protein A2016_12025 [Elusimicrobia bacterium GWF2_62_30]HBA62200.1 hypothetical protein [Elusimicrobiota bacterium]